MNRGTKLLKEWPKKNVQLHHDITEDKGHLQE